MEVKGEGRKKEYASWKGSEKGREEGREERREKGTVTHCIQNAPHGPDIFTHALAKVTHVPLPESGN